MSTEHSGRTELRDVLDDLVSQKKEKDQHIEVDEDVEEAARELMEYSSPRKRPYKQRRKRKRTQKDSLSDTFSDEEKESSSSEVITIYGRHLNLSRLGSNPSLYSVCRDWVRNDPLGQVHQPNVPHSEILPLPPEVPECLPVYNIIDKPEIDMNDMDNKLALGMSNEQLQTLKTEYLQNWKGVQQKWRKLSKQSQQKHKKSIELLQSMQAV